MEFKDWVYQKYLDWRGDSRGTVQQYAQFLKVSQPSVNAWINGTRGVPTSKKIITRLVEVYGNEVYSVLGYPRPEYEELDVSSLPEELRGNLRSALTEIEYKLEKNALSSDSPEAEKMIRESLSKYGFEVKTNRNSG